MAQLKLFKETAYKGEIPELQVTYKGVFNFEALYELVHDFLLENGFTDADYPESGGAPDMFEARYLEKGGAPLTGYWINWLAHKIPEGNTYYKYLLEIRFQGIALSKADVVEQGKKVSRDKGEINVFIKGNVQTDYKKEWENHWLLKNFKNYYDKRIMFEEFNDMHETTLYRTIYRLQAVIKRYFKLMGGELAPEKTAPVRG